LLIRSVAPASWSRKLLRASEPSGATLVYTHSLFPGWGKIVREGDRYRWVGG